MTMNTRVKVSIVIKAFNEEAKIGSTIVSAIHAISFVGGEVILADSYSTDRTVSIASKYPIKITQLTNPDERCCGIGGQLGYQAAFGEFIWIVDGDMVLSAEFLAAALRTLENEPQLAGVGGRVIEKNLDSLEFRARLLRAPVNLQPGEVDRLDGGGVYRRSAIISIGYFTNRNLHSYEEYELAARLRTAGWKLKRMNIESVTHFGHQIEAYSLLKKRWTSGYVLGIGELLRSAIWKPHLKLILIEVKELRLYSIVIIWWIFLIYGFFEFSNYKLVVINLAVAPFAVMSLRKKSIPMGIYSVFSWNFYAIGLLRGLFKKQYPPNKIIKSQTILSATSNITVER
ncbi:hypothetical protein MIZ03_3053 [Rhodoferax lithotrophicus]|uniref:Glycosyltransferase 2-like domain-containing protein n=1 Tax=Rhodoferax lithotrophicus TaxID=2798804 RepID=A0ABN6DBF1_9BURK|nr:glycosyltransferase [Rhodoferax sp. MIZ03]BCO28156.1 hypothetical protein MIZ03_3053 [Rhodoferax sp. MIZ03]